MTDFFYPYTSGDLLENRNTYFYTPFGGQEFLRAWRRQRAMVLAACGTRSVLEPQEDGAPTTQVLRRLKTEVRTSPLSPDSRVTLDRILQRFEVSKRLHDDYTSAWKPLDPACYHGVERYLLLAEILGQAAALTGDLRYLNGLLKCVDTLTADGSDMACHFRDRMRDVLDQEGELVDRAAVRAPRSHPPVTQAAMPAPLAKPVILQGIGLAAAPTARSRAYIQALAASGLHPEFVLLLGDHGIDPSTPPSSPSSWQGISLVDLNESVIATCRRAGIPTHWVQGSGINDKPALEAIRRLQPHTLIYSGAGGQIVSSQALGMGARFLHMHAGHIPDYRGSTTIYYALLKGERPSVTGIFLDPQIDTGGILAHQSYPTPDRNIDIDRVYDASIRADTLVRLLYDYMNRGTFAPPQVQNQEAGTTYFVIHPVLKHLAILSLPEHDNG